MANKGRAKYPNQGKPSHRRLLSQALLLLAVAGGIFFYFYIHHSEPDDGGTLYNLGLSIGDARKRAGEPGDAADDDGKADAPVVKQEISRDTIPAPPPSSRAADAAAAEARKRSGATGPSYSAPVNRETVVVYPKPETPAVPEQPSRPPAPDPVETAPKPEDSDTPAADGGKLSEDVPEVLSPDGSKAEGPGDMPFDGLSVEEAAEELSRKYRGAPSGQWGERVAGVVTHLELNEERSGDSPLVIALTFDACDGGRDGYDAELIAFLREKQIPATLFVTSLWLRRHGEILRELAADPLFEIAAHGERHRPCSVNGKRAYGIHGTASMEELVREVLSNAREIVAVTGKNPLWFRSGTAYYDELAVEVIQDLGMGIAGYSIAGDQGATLSSSAVEARTLQARNGDILLFHMNKPRSGTRAGLVRALPVLRERGARFVRLSDHY